MPLLGRNNRRSPSPIPEPDNRHKRSGSMFSRNKNRDNYESQPMHDTNHSTRNGGGGGLFGTFRRSSDSSSDSSRSRSLSNDPSISAARQKVSDAESAERLADQALGSARAAVRSARDHVRMLEREAVEEYV